MRRIYYVSGINNAYQYSKVGGPCEVAMVGLKDLRLLLAVARAAETVQKHRNHSLRDLRLAADFLIAALDKLNAKWKGRK